MQNCEVGRSMIEMLGVLAVIGVLSVGGLAGFNKAMHQQKINASLEQIGMISSKLSSFGASADSYTGLSNATAVKLRAVPANAIDGANLVNPFGGSIQIKASNIASGSQDEQAYAIIYKGLSEAACISIGSSTWFQSKGDSILGIGIGKSGLTAKESLIFQGCTGGTDGSTYALACPAENDTEEAKNDFIAIPLDVGRASLACTCPANDCEFIVKFF